MPSTDLKRAGTRSGTGTKSKKVLCRPWFPKKSERGCLWFLTVCFLFQKAQAAAKPFTADSQISVNAGEEVKRMEGGRGKMTAIRESPRAGRRSTKNERHRRGTCKLICLCARNAEGD